MISPGPLLPRRAPVRIRFAGVLLALLVLALETPLLAQDPQGVQEIPELEQQYRVAQAEYDAAFRALEAREAQFERAIAADDAARISGDEARAEETLTEVNRLAAEVREVRLRVDQRAQELREARARLIRAYRQRVDQLFAQGELTRDPAERGRLAAILEDTNNRLLELLGEEDPVTTLEPLRDLTISQTDSPRDILRMASILERRAEQDSVRLVEVGRQLTELREDQARTRRVADFLSDMERFGDTRLPVGQPGNRATNPDEGDRRPPAADSLGTEVRPMTLEERVQSLEILQEELQERIRLIRARAERFRARAGGGEWA